MSPVFSNIPVVELWAQFTVKGVFFTPKARVKLWETRPWGVYLKIVTVGSQTRRDISSDGRGIDHHDVGGRGRPIWTELPATKLLPLMVIEVTPVL